MTKSKLIPSVFASALALSIVACASAPSERYAKIEQHIDPADEAGDDAGDEPADPGCAHAICATGAALDATCDPCATTLCAADPYCCAVTWDATCVGEVISICGQSCTSAPPDAGTPSSCVHPICATGVALTASCDACATTLCAADPYCCAVTWDATCVGEVTSICGQSCQ